MVFIGNAISTWYLMVLHQNPPVSWADCSTSPTRCSSSPRCSRSRSPAAPGWSAGSSCSTPRWCWSAARWRSGTSRSAPPRRVGEQQPRHHAARLRLPAGEHAGAARHHDGDPPPAHRREPGGLRPHRRRRAHQRRGRPHLQPGVAGDPAGAAPASIDGAYLLCYVMLIAGAELYYRRPVPGVDRRGATPGRATSRSVPCPTSRSRPPTACCSTRCSSPWTDPVSGLAVGALLVTCLRGGPAAPRGAGERPAPRRDGRAAERGPVPLAGAALVRRHHRDPRQRHDAVREPVRHPGVRLRPLRDGGPADRRPCCTPTTATAPRRSFEHAARTPA